MPHFNNFIFDQVLAPAITLFFFIGGIVAVATAVGLMANSAGLFRVFALMNQSVSTRKATKSISVPIDSRNFVLKYRGWIGAFFVVGAAYALYGLTARIDNAAVVSLLNLKFPGAFVSWIVESVRLFLIITCAASVLVGILLVFFPDVIRAIEVRSDHWYSTRRIAPQAEKMNLTLDRWVAASPRAAGLVIVFPALAVVAYFGAVLFGPR